MILILSRLINRWTISIKTDFKWRIFQFEGAKGCYLLAARLYRIYTIDEYADFLKEALMIAELYKSFQ